MWFCVRKALRNILAFNFLKVTVFSIHGSKSFTVCNILRLAMISFEKIQPPKHTLCQTVNGIIRIQRLHQLRYHRFWLLFSILYRLFNKIKRDVPRNVRNHMKIKFNGLSVLTCRYNKDTTTSINCWGHIVCWTNFVLNLVEKKFPSKDCMSKFTSKCIRHYFFK